MKKLILLLCLSTLCCTTTFASYLDEQLDEMEENIKYNAVKKHTQKFEFQQNFDNTIKDPGLIKLSDFTPVNENLYKQKLLNDEKIYKTKIFTTLNKKTNSVNIEPVAVDFYNIYRISERLIRANNLDYVNWRITIKKSLDDFNASASAGNHIQINTALYDSLYTNNDALAFVIAHEMAHLIFGHQQRKAEIDVTLSKFLAATGDPGAVGAITGTIALGKLKLVSNEIKRMEFLADAEAMNLLVKAGYSPEKAFDALKFMNTLAGANIKFFIDSHPTTNERVKSVQENLSVINPEWVEEGKANIYQSEVLDCKKSSDRVSIVIGQSTNSNKEFYKPETLTKRLTRIAYVNYLQGNMQNAAKYFEKLASKTNDPIAYLYLSYANESLYNKTQSEKYKKRALTSISKAIELQPNNKFIKEQYSNISSTL